MPAPSLYKPKSKLRLRLGLTPPHPKPAPSVIRHVVPPLPTTSSAVSPPRSSSLTAAALTESTSSFTTGTSRPDSRSLFAYDSTSPSSQGNHHLTTISAGLEFDTISYASTSPASLAFNRAIHPSPLINNNYPTPSTSGYDTYEADADADGEGEFELDLTDQGDGIDRPSLDFYPNIRSVIKASDDVFYISDGQLSDRFHFVAEVGYGNWGSVWLAKPRRPRSAYFSSKDMTPNQRAVRKLGRSAAASGGSGAGGKVAMKIVHRCHDPCTAARIRALWGEMKIIQSLKHEPHPSIIQFEAFCLTPSYAVIIMPYLSHLIQVCLPPRKATPYLRQLASAVGYLHERGITHNDIKPANVMMTHNDIPVLVDFGFAHRWPMNKRGAFLSTISWGTPEYLDPYRAQGLPHDERASDIWSLGITFYEILIGRTPFEENEEEEFIEPEQYAIYLERTISGEWLGEYGLPADLTHLIEHMLHPNHSHRISAMQTYHHPALQPAAPSILVTPHFIREATSYDDYSEEPLPPILAPVGVALDGGAEDKKRRKKRVAKESVGQRSVTPALPLGESIKQHTSVPKGKKGEEVETPSPKKGSRLIIKKIRSEERNGGIGKDDEEDITPTKIVKPAQPLKMQDTTTNKAEKKLISRPSQAQLRDISRTTSRTISISKHDSIQSFRAGTGTDSARSSSILTKPKSKENLAPTTKTLSHRTSNLSTLSTVSTVQSKEGGNEEEARLRTMQSLEGRAALVGSGAGGKKKDARDVLSAISRPAPEPPVSTPVSVDTATALEGKKEKEKVQRRSWATERVLKEVCEEEVEEVTMGGIVLENKEDLDVRVSSSSDIATEQVKVAAEPAFRTMPRSKTLIMDNVGSPPRKRMAKPAVPDSVDQRSPAPRLAFGSPSATGGKKGPVSDGLTGSPASKVKKMMTDDQEKLGRFRQISGDLTPVQFTPSTNAVRPPSTIAPRPHPSTEIAQPDLANRKSVEALALDNRLDKISEWVKTVESIVDEARRALAEGRELPLPLLTIPIPVDMTGLPSMPTSTITTTNNLPTPRANTTGTQRSFGVSPEAAIPIHMRTSSTQVEPSTPPKWMTYAEAEERIKRANSWMEEGKRYSGTGSRPNSGMALIGAGMGVGDVKRGLVKKERGSVASVLKLFSAEKEKEKEKAGVRSSTPEPNMHIPLKPPAPALRATPSTPMLRSESSSTNPLSQTQRMPTRKSESNLSRAFNTLPTLPTSQSHITFSDLVQQSAFSDDDDDDDYGTTTTSNIDRRGQTTRSPRRLYERFLDSTPGVVRQGDGWSSGHINGPGMKPILAKPSSMASLRERARMLLHGADSHSTHSISSNITNSNDIGGIITTQNGTTSSGRKIIDLANQERRNSYQPLVHSEKFGTGNSTIMSSVLSSSATMGGTQRPSTPGASSVLGSNGADGQKGWGIWKGIKGLGKKKNGEGMEELRV